MRVDCPIARLAWDTCRSKMAVDAISKTSHSQPTKRVFHPLLFLPGLLFWGLVGVGIATENQTMLGVSALFAVVCVITGISIKVRAAKATRDEQARVWFEGTPATAKVVSISSSGGLNDNPRVDFELEICPEGQQSFPATVTAIVSKLAIPRIQPDCQLKVRFDPEERTNIALDESVLYLRYSRAS